MAFIPHISAPDQESTRLRLDGGHLYLARPGLVAAVNAALTLRRPLLLTGEPGSGKTRFAEACARWFHTHWARLGADMLLRPPEREAVCIIRSSSRAADLLYRFDALARFGDAQLEGDARLWARNPRNYLSLEPLGRSLVSGRFSVVLIDEIDKSPRDLPNDLLDVLEARRFEIPELREAETESYQRYIGTPLEPQDPPLQRWMHAPGTSGEARYQTWPLIIITSNTERQLPAAFMRRCVCHHLMPFDKPDLERIVKDRFPGLEEGDSGLGSAVLDLFLFLRSLHLEKPPGAAELLDALEVVDAERKGASSPAVFSEGLKALLLGSGGATGMPPKEVRKLWPDLGLFGCLVKLEVDVRKVVA